MLFRRSTRKRFVCLVAVFTVTMGFNTWHYIQAFDKTEGRKQRVLTEDAFKLFFVRTRTPEDHGRYRQRYAETWDRLGAVTIDRAFVYQNNLYIHFADGRPVSDTGADGPGQAALFRVFNISPDVRTAPADGDADPYTATFRNVYLDYNGAGLDAAAAAERDRAVKADLLDAADLIRGNMSGARLAVFNDLTGKIIDSLRCQPADRGASPNPYLSRIGLIVPLNLLHMFRNLRDDNNTDIVDFSNAIRMLPEATLAADRRYLPVPAAYRLKPMYADIALYPRYTAVYAPGLLGARWRGLLYEDIGMDTDFTDALGRLHFKGNHLFSYEKLKMITESVRAINRDIQANVTDFFLTDLSMGIAFPFMISLFSFVHLKAEFAFLLMFKNRIRELVAIFWLLPLLVMLVFKSGVVAAYGLWTLAGGSPPAATWHMIVPMAVSFLLAAAAFYPMNRWCFAQFTGSRLNLSALHRGR